jgi:hypothetical protein
MTGRFGSYVRCWKNVGIRWEDGSLFVVLFGELALYLSIILACFGRFDGSLVCLIFTTLAFLLNRTKVSKFINMYTPFEGLKSEPVVVVYECNCPEEDDTDDECTCDDDECTCDDDECTCDDDECTCDDDDNPESETTEAGAQTEQQVEWDDDDCGCGLCSRCN